MAKNESKEVISGVVIHVVANGVCSHIGNMDNDTAVVIDAHDGGEPNNSKCYLVVMKQNSLIPTSFFPFYSLSLNTTIPSAIQSIVDDTTAAIHLVFNKKVLWLTEGAAAQTKA